MLQRELTGREQLALIAGLYGVSSERVGFWLERVRLTADADRAIGTYSRGMRQRLALARALLSEPELVLLDEPTTGLDAASREVLWELIGDLRAAGRIVVVITHDLDAPPELFSRAVVLSQGRLVADRSGPESLSALYAAALQRVPS
jgi:Cu-processing system ATP-binding protein